MQAVRLKTEYLINPVGIDSATPWLYWNCEGGKKQTAWQIIAADDRDRTLWDSGKVESSSMRVRWGGKPIPPVQGCGGKSVSGMKIGIRESGRKRYLRPASTGGRQSGLPEITG